MPTESPKEIRRSLKKERRRLTRKTRQIPLKGHEFDFYTLTNKMQVRGKVNGFQLARALGVDPGIVAAFHFKITNKGLKLPILEWPSAELTHRRRIRRESAKRTYAKKTAKENIRAYFSNAHPTRFDDSSPRRVVEMLLPERALKEREKSHQKRLESYRTYHAKPESKEKHRQEEAERRKDIFKRDQILELQRQSGARQREKERKEKNISHYFTQMHPTRADDADFEKVAAMSISTAYEKTKKKKELNQKQKRKKYLEEYYSRPGKREAILKYWRGYGKKPEVKEKRDKYKKSSEYKEKTRKYDEDRYQRIVGTRAFFEQMGGRLPEQREQRKRRRR